MTFKRSIYFVLLLALAGMFQSCKDSCTSEQTFINYTPIWLSFDEFRQDLKIEDPRDLVNPGKLYYYESYLFINERGEGIHVFDNSNPANPVALSFIEIPGNMDMAVKENILFANNYVDLVTIDISSPANPVYENRVESVFPAFSTDGNDRLLVGYTEEPRTIITDCNNWGFFLEDTWVDVDPLSSTVPISASELSGNSAIGGVGSVGVGGSMARFTIVDDYLYTVDENNLLSFDLTDLSTPEPTATVQVGWGVETIYPSQGHLFIGTNSGMFIYGLDNPAAPNYKSDFIHANACDPVVVKDDYAYVTLRSGTACQGFINQMDLVNIENLFAPTLERSFQMHNPHGLSILGDNLFLCEGSEGLKVFDISDPLTLDERLIEQKRDFFGFDAIALESNLLLVIGEDGLYQFDATDASNLQQLSVIPVIK